jgi:hypothetical protein
MRFIRPKDAIKDKKKIFLMSSEEVDLKYKIKNIMIIKWLKGFSKPDVE